MDNGNIRAETFVVSRSGIYRGWIALLWLLIVSPFVSTIAVGAVNSPSPLHANAETNLLPGHFLPRDGPKSSCSQPGNRIEDEANNVHLGYEMEQWGAGAGESLYLWADGTRAPLPYDSVIHQGSWTLGENQVDVVVHGTVLDDDFIAMVNGSVSNEPGMATLARGTLLVGGNAAASDQNLIHSALATAPGGVEAGCGPQETGLVEVSVNSLLDAAILILGQPGTGRLLAPELVVDAKDDLATGESLVAREQRAISTDLEEVVEDEQVAEASSGPPEDPSSDEPVLLEATDFADDMLRGLNVKDAAGSRTAGAMGPGPFGQWTVSTGYYNPAPATPVPAVPEFEEPRAIDPGVLLSLRASRPTSPSAKHPASVLEAPAIRIQPQPPQVAAVDPPSLFYAEVEASSLPGRAVRQDSPKARPSPVPGVDLGTPGPQVPWRDRAPELARSPLQSPVPDELIAAAASEGMPEDEVTDVGFRAATTLRFEENASSMELDEFPRLFIGAGESVFLWADKEGAPERYESVINRGSWMLAGDRVDVVVNDYVLNDGFIALVNGAIFTKPNGAIVNNGTLLIDGGATFTDRNIINATTSDAYFGVRNGSTATATDDFVAGSGQNLTGLVEVSGNSLLEAALLVLGKSGVGELFATNSVIDVENDLVLGEKDGSAGNLYLDSTMLTVGGKLKLGKDGLGTLTAIGSDLVIGDSVVIAEKNGSSASLLLDDSTLDIGKDFIVGKQNDTTVSIDLTGGSSFYAAGEAKIGEKKEADVTMTVRDGATFEVEEKLKINEASAVSIIDATLLAGDETEVKGVLSLSGATVLLDDKLKVEGSLLTEGSLLSIAKDFELKKDSVVLGGVGDVYQIGEDFKIGIEMATDFDLSEVTVSFVGPIGTKHKLQVRGLDVGADPDGYSDNYAFGGLHLGTGQTLELDDKVGGGGALYIGAVILDDGISQLANIGGDPVILYYDASLPENDYLNGDTYELGNQSGTLTPGIIVPEPSTLGLFGLALLLFRVFRAGSKRSNRVQYG